MSPKRFLGRVCEKYPELQGERYISNRDCLGCIRNRSKSDPLYKEKRSARVKRWKELNKDKTVPLQPCPKCSGGCGLEYFDRYDSSHMARIACTSCRWVSEEKFARGGDECLVEKYAAAALPQAKKP